VKQQLASGCYAVVLAGAPAGLGGHLDPPSPLSRDLLLIIGTIWRGLAAGLADIFMEGW